MNFKAILLYFSSLLNFETLLQCLTATNHDQESQNIEHLFYDYVLEENFVYTVQSFDYKESFSRGIIFQYLAK
jgi:hypothetical protein